MENRKQCVKINNTSSSLKIISSGVPQGSVVGPLLFNLFINDRFYFIEKVSIHNFADDNTLSSAKETVFDLIEILKSESENAAKWFSDNKMFVNPDKFKFIIIQKHKTLNQPDKILFGNNSVEITSSVKLECAKLRALRVYVTSCLACPRAYVPSCLRALMPCLP